MHAFIFQHFFLPSAKMDRMKFLLLKFLPLFLFFTDIISLFTPRPSQIQQLPRYNYYQPKYQSFQQQHFHFPTQKPSSVIGSAVGVGCVININFCTSCSYRGHAITIQNMLEAAFPGIHVILGNHPPPILKRLMSKVVPIFQVGIIVTIMGGEQIFPKLGYMTPPPWYYSLKANRFGAIVSTWLFGNFMQSYFKSSGAFEVFCNGQLVFSKLMEQRFPGEFELRELVRKKLYNSRMVDGIAGGFSS